MLEFALNYKRHGWIPASVLGRASIPDEVPMETMAPRDLPKRWSNPDPPEELREMGEDWLVRAATVCLKVPSAIIHEEWNYLLNPRHPDFGRLGIGRVERFHFDRRLARTGAR